MIRSDEFKLASIGLNHKQITSVLSRISGSAVDDFIHKWNQEKMLGNLQSNNNVERGLYEARRNEHNNYERTQELRVNYSNDSNSHLNYMPRMLPNRTEKISSEEMQKKYQEQTQSRTNPSANLDIMSSQLFGKPPQNGYSAEYLHKKYKQLAVSLHPDKRGGDASAFNMLTTCYNYLKSNLPEIATFEETSQFQPRRPVAVPPPDSLFESKFDPSVFNEYYTKNAFQEKTEGYGNWLKDQPDIKQPQRPSESNFNSVYENQKKEMMRNLDPSRLQLIKSKEVPDEINNRNFAGGSLLGGDGEIDDFTGETANGTKYTDVRRALEITHLTYDNEPIIEGNVAKDFATAKQNHGVQPTQFSEAELNAYQETKLKKQEEEENRRYRLRQYDEDIDHHFKQTHHNRLTM